jgi:endo-1,3(4)-beta-glucanase
MKDYAKKVDAIMYDVAYQGNFVSTHRQTTGPFFPGTRYKSWFDGHSFASGLFPAANGKSQESSSEAVNCYYGVYLWSLARNGALVNPSSDTSAGTDFARLLLATEIIGAKTYWQMLPSSTSNQTTSSGNKTSVVSTSSMQLPQQGVYGSRFASNLMVGNVGMLDAVCRTWFGKELLYVHMINFLPVTSISGELFTRPYATQEYQTVLKSLEANPAWIGFVIANHAISAPNMAWTDALTVSSAELDPGLSKSQLLYWIATREGFATPNSQRLSGQGQGNTSSGSSSSNIPPSPLPATSSSDGTCSANPKCAALGLVGNCCPTPNGRSLGKCLCLFLLGSS